MLLREVFVLKVRIKFSKTGALKYIGHLDVMRYFQKLIRRSKLPVSYSEGFSPHQIMSFAMPLGISDESIGEYVDIEISEKVTSEYAINALNAVSVPEIQVLSFREIPEGKKYNAMASITAAAYEVKIREEACDKEALINAFEIVLAKDQITILKKSKKTENVIDIKPFIYDYKVNEDSFYLLLSCGSVMNIKPELVFEAVFNHMDIEFDEYYVMVKRLEMYTGEKNSLISLDDVGKDII